MNGSYILIDLLIMKIKLIIQAYSFKSLNTLNLTKNKIILRNLINLMEFELENNEPHNQLSLYLLDGDSEQENLEKREYLISSAKVR